MGKGANETVGKRDECDASGSIQSAKPKSFFTPASVRVIPSTGESFRTSLFTFCFIIKRILLGEIILRDKN